MTRGQVLRRGALGALAVGLALQVVPLGAWQFSNPPVIRAAAFPTADG